MRATSLSQAHLPILSLLIVIACCGQALAQGGTWLMGEEELRTRDLGLQKLFSATEEWLGGRMSLDKLKAELGEVKRVLASPAAGLPEAERAEIVALDTEVLGRVQAFSDLTEPSVESQKILFADLARLMRQRNLWALSWRKKELNRKLGQGPDAAPTRYLRWELSWVPIWEEEIHSTYELQSLLLALSRGESGTSQKGKELTRRLLALQERAGNIAVPNELRALQDLSEQRLTLLARTSEQLLRLEQGQSRGALQRVRKLSRELAEFTERFQTLRLEKVRALP